MIKYLLPLLLVAQSALAGLPPTSTKAIGDSVPATTFEFDFPTFSVTRTGTVSSLTPNTVFSATAGENLTAGQVVYISIGSGSGDTARTTGSAYKVDATNANRVEWVGIVRATVLSGASVSIISSGKVTGYSSLSPGIPVYADPATPGALTQVVPTTATQYILQIGIADTSSSIIMNGAGSATAIYIDSVPSGAPTVTSTRASPSSIVAGTGVAFTGNHIYNIWFIQGSGGAVTVSANPQIAAGTTVGQQLILQGRSATNTVTLADGTGLSLNGSVVLGLNNIIALLWDGTTWTELYRSY